MRFNFVCVTLDQRQTIVFMAAVIIPDLSLALFYNFDLVNGIDFLKDFRAASPQRGSWRSQRRGRVASPVMIGAD